LQRAAFFMGKGREEGAIPVKQELVKQELLKQKAGNQEPPKQGKTGRPKGAANRVTAEMRRSARAYSDEALDMLVELMRGGDKRVSLSAAQEILNRAWGRPGAALEEEVDHRGQLETQSEEVLDERIRELIRQTGIGAPAGREKAAEKPETD